MIDIESMVDATVRDGYNRQNAEAKVCQDIVLKAISEGSLKRNVTIKGGVVMRSITGDARRATQDMDLDFIRYSLNEDAIYRFIKELNSLEGVDISIIGDIEELSQQEYRGKRVFIRIRDQKNYELNSKIDLGVHANHDIEQDNYCFDVCMDDEGASLLINSREQIFTEKLRSLMRFGPLSTRYKDIFDMYYLTDTVDTKRLKTYIRAYILDEKDMRENEMDDIVSRMERTFRNRTYRSRIQRALKANWIDEQVNQVFDKLLMFIRNI